MNHPILSKESWVIFCLSITIITVSAVVLIISSFGHKKLEDNLKQSIDYRHGQVIESFDKTDKSLNEVNDKLEAMAK